MPARVVISSLAKEDLREPVQWYKGRNSKLSRRLLTEIRRTTHHIAENPFSYAISYSEMRIAVVSIFPYTIHYIFQEDKNVVFIAAIFHTSLNPRKWDKRG